METRLMSPLALLRQAWSLALSRPHVISYLILGALPQLVSFGFSAVVAFATGTTDIQTAATDLFANAGGWGIAGTIALGLVLLAGVSLVSAWYTALLYMVYQATALEKLTGLSSYITRARHVTLGLLKTYIVVGLMTLLGFLLFIIPGIILAVRYSFAPLIAALENPSVKPIDESKRLVKGRFWKLVGRSLVMIVCYNIPLSVLQAIHPLFGTVWAVTSPVFGLYFFLVYMDFKHTAIVTTE